MKNTYSQKDLIGQLTVELGSYSFNDKINITLPHACYNLYPEATTIHESAHRELVISTPFGMFQRIIFQILSENNLPNGDKEKLEKTLSFSVKKSFEVQEGTANYVALSLIKHKNSQEEVNEIYSNGLPDSYRNAIGNFEKFLPSIVNDPPLEFPLYSLLPTFVGIALLSSPILEFFSDYKTILEPSTFSIINQHSPDSRLHELISKLEKTAFLEELLEETRVEINNFLRENGLISIEPSLIFSNEWTVKSLFALNQFIKDVTLKKITHLAPSISVIQNRSDTVALANKIITSAKAYYKEYFSISVLTSIAGAREKINEMDVSAEIPDISFSTTKNIPYQVINYQEFRRAVSNLASWKSDVIIVVMYNHRYAQSKSTVIKDELMLEPGEMALGLICLPSFDANNPLSSEQIELFNDYSYKLALISREQIHDTVKYITGVISSVSWTINDFNFIDLLKENNPILSRFEKRCYIFLNRLNEDAILFAVDLLRQSHQKILCWAAKNKTSLFLVIQGNSSNAIWLSPALPMHFELLEQQLKGDTNITCMFKTNTININAIKNFDITMKIIYSHYN
jgi:hypothetical protein